MKRSVTAATGGRRVRRTLPPGVITRLRLERELSQLQLSIKAEVSVETVSRLERGLHGPRATTLGLIGNALGVTVEQILGPGRSPW